MSIFSGHSVRAYLIIKFMDPMQELRAHINGEIFDSQILMYYLRKYNKPRDKVALLLKQQAIIQVKKGLYVFGSHYRKGPLFLEIIAGMLVQPSYISKEYALSQYGLLIERVESVTCMTTKKKKQFNTPLGHFDYCSLSQKKFGIGVEMREIPQEGGYLFATREKALADWLASVPPIADTKTLQFFLYEESRIEKTALDGLNQSLLREISKVYRNRNVELLLTI